MPPRTYQYHTLTHTQGAQHFLNLPASDSNGCFAIGLLPTGSTRAPAPLPVPDMAWWAANVGGMKRTWVFLADPLRTAESSLSIPWTIPKKGNLALVATRWQCSAAQVLVAIGPQPFRSREKAVSAVVGRLSKTEICITQKHHPLIL